MKLVRWPIAAASAFVIYKYTIGRKAKGENVLATPDDAESVPRLPRPATKARPKPNRGPKA
ncbi:MAG: hypothetical protein ABIM50_07025 [Novosphingobium sp.]